MDRLREAVIDGRTENVRYRQNELQNIHSSLRENADRLRLAITKDSHGEQSSYLSLEAEVEYSHTMNAVRAFYSSLDFERSLKDEYSISNSMDNPSRKVGKGLVVIRPTTHTRLYSIICPIAAAITAGNCICLELQDTTLHVDQVLKEVLPNALDVETFHISSVPLQDYSSLFLVDQGAKDSNPTPSQLFSNPSARTIAIVDRAADIELAAKTIVNARFTFQGTSPYSPDIVIVNNFVKAKFTEACVQYASKFHTTETQPRRPHAESETKKALNDAEEKGQASSFGSRGFVLSDIQDKNSPVAKMKVNGCHLLFLECTSLVDAIMSQSSESTLLAAYLFSDPPTAKFLAQHLNATTTYVNQIPLSLLIGPAAPITPLSAPISHKYSTDMFSSPRPQHISAPAKELQSLEEVLDRSSSGNSEVLLHTLRKEAVEPLPATGQPVGHAVGFFEQGIFLGAGLFLTIVVPTMAYGSWYIGKNVWKMARR